MFSSSLVALLFLATLGPGEPGEPLSEPELTKFLGPGTTSAMTWSRVGGPDFGVYYGRAIPPLTGGVGIYLGGWPSFEPEPSSTVVAGQLGIFPVKWHRTVSSKGEIRQEAVIQLDEDYLKAHVWIGAERQADFDKLLGEVSQLPTFSFRHESPFRDEILRERRALLAACLLCPALFGGSVWLLDRLIRRKRASTIRRGLALVGAGVGWALLVFGLELLPLETPNYLINAVGYPATRWGLLVILASATISLLAGLIMIGVSFTRLRFARRPRSEPI